MNQVTTRDADEEDIKELTFLMNELGYATTSEEMLHRFSRISTHHDYKTVVALADGEVVGMVGLAKGLFYEKNGGYLRVLSLIVKQSSRGMGIGKVLLTAAEDWAKEQGLATLLINCGNRDEREHAQRFYHEMGYVIKSSGFVKQL
jgi:GNAT superfamily N-acetyltransferase